MAEIIIHPAMTRDLVDVLALEERLGMTAFIEDRRIVLTGQPQWTGRPAPQVERRNGSLFVITENTK